jgi:AmiR/NasT family two-component response regulator
VAGESLAAGNDLAQRVAAARREAEANVLRLDLVRSRLQATRLQISASRAERQVLHDSVLARLTARLDSESVIEQAKGVLIAKVGCTADQALGMLRAASQRTNVDMRDLARDIVDRAVSIDHIAAKLDMGPWTGRRPTTTAGRNGAGSGQSFAW